MQPEDIQRLKAKTDQPVTVETKPQLVKTSLLRRVLGMLINKLNSKYK